MEMDKSLIILALETLSEQVSDGTDWECCESSFEGQERLDRIDKQIDLMKSRLQNEANANGRIPVSDEQIPERFYLYYPKD